MANSIGDTIQMYVAAWNENDDARRAELLAGCVAEAGVLTFPGNHVVGREQLHALMAAFRREHPHDKAALTQAVDQHHRCFRFTGTGIRPDGTTYGNTTEVGEVDADGLIVRVLSFADP